MVVADWLSELGLPQYVESFEENRITADILTELTTEDLRELGVVRLGDRKRLQKAIALLKDNSSPTGDLDSAEVVQGKEVVHQPQRRQLTLMFCDLIGSTSLSTALDPEDLRELIRTYQETCRKVIVAHEGFISRYMGDGILVYFGYPRASERSAESAVRAGLEIIRAMDVLNHGDGNKFGVDLGVRLGIATGPVVVGDIIGAGASEEAAVVGETPNLAARMQGLAAPNTLVVTDSTRKLVGHSFNYEDLGLQAVKGVAAPMQCWRVESENTAQWQHSSQLSGPESPMVNRSHELALLQTAWQQACDGTGQAIVIGGEAGIGKSRVSGALKEILNNQKCHILHLQGVAFRRNTALYPVTESLRLAAGIEAGDSAELRARRLHDLVRGESLGEVESVRLFAPLLSVELTDEVEPLELSAARLKSLTLEALWQRLSNLSQARPVVVFIEDYHWLDPTTRELLDLGLPFLSKIRVLLVITQRLVELERWQQHPAVTILSLQRLEDEHVRELITNTLADDSIPAVLQDEIFNRTDGVPLFIEELTRMLQERIKRESLVDGKFDTRYLDSQIPTTLQDLLLARLDQLGPGRSLAQQGACFGRTFTRTGLSVIAELPEDELESQLQILLASGLVHQVPEVVDQYEFKHALVQDTAYESLLKSSRVRFHRQIAEYFEAEYAEHEPEILAHHFGYAGMHEQACTYWHKAGQLAMGASAYIEAISYFQRALTALTKSRHRSDANRLELELNIQLAIPLSLTRGWAADAVGVAYDRAHELSLQLGESSMLYAALSGIFRYYLVTGNFAFAEQLAKADLNRARKSGDDGVIMEFSVHPGVVFFYSGRHAQSLPHFKRCFELYDLQKHRDHLLIYGQCTATVALLHWGKSLLIMGKLRQGTELNRSSAQHADAAEHVFSQAWALTSQASNNVLLENVAECRLLSERLIELCEESDIGNWLAQGWVWLGWAMVHAEPDSNGDTSIAVEHNRAIQDGLAKIQQGIDAWKNTGVTLMQPFYFTLLAQCQLRAAQYNEAQQSTAHSIEIMDATGENWCRPLTMLIREEATLALSDSGAEQSRNRIEKILADSVAQQHWLWAYKAQRLLNHLYATEQRISCGETWLAHMPHSIPEDYEDLSEHPILRKA